MKLRYGDTTAWTTARQNRQHVIITDTLALGADWTPTALAQKKNEPRRTHRGRDRDQFANEVAVASHSIP